MSLFSACHGGIMCNHLDRFPFTSLGIDLFFCSAPTMISVYSSVHEVCGVGVTVECKIETVSCSGVTVRYKKRQSVLLVTGRCKVGVTVVCIIWTMYGIGVTVNCVIEANQNGN